MKGTFKFSNGVQIINCTPHVIRFRKPKGDTVEVEPSGFQINARVEEAEIVHPQSSLFQLVSSKFLPTEKGLEEIARIRAELGNETTIIGSAISAQAYRGTVKMMVLEEARVNIKEKIARSDKFAIF